MILVFWMLSFKPTFLLSSFTFIKRLFRSFLVLFVSSLKKRLFQLFSPLSSVIRVASSVYQRLLIFLLAILIPACASSSPVFLMMYSAYKLNKVKLLSCVWLWNPMDYSLPGSSIHEIFQARALEWVAISFSRGSSRPRDRTLVSHIAGRCFNLWATKEA